MSFELNKKVILFEAVVCALFFLLPQSAQAYSISPLRQSIVVDPGSESLVTIDVTNNEQNAIIIEGTVDSYIVDPAKGFPTFDQSSPAEKWVTPEFDRITILPGETTRLPFSISPAANAEPGSYYLSLFATTIPEGGQVSVEQRLGSLLFLDVAGIVQERLVIDFFSTSQQFYVVGPIHASLQLNNSGTYHAVPTGIISVKNAFGKEIFKSEINASNRTIFADMRWIEEYIIDELAWSDVGPLTIEARLHYGLTDQFINEKFVVWYLPLSLIGTCIGICILIFVALIMTVRRLRSRRH